MGIETHVHPQFEPGSSPTLALDLAALTRVLLGVTPSVPPVPAAAAATEPDPPAALPEERGHGGLSASRRSGAMLAELSFLDD